MSQELQTISAQAPTPMVLLEMAMSQGADLDKLQKLMELQERWEASEARKSFNVAFAAFKAEAVCIVRTKEVTDGPLKGKKQAELGEIVKAITPALSQHGLSLSWRLTKDEKDWMEVTCTLRHVGGHFETVSMGGAPDTGPGRNAIQARGSAKTYLERYTTLGILGLAPEDDNDGRSFGMDEGTFQAHLKAINGAETVEDLQKAYTAAYRASGNDKPTQAALIKAKDARKGELRGAK